MNAILSVALVAAVFMAGTEIPNRRDVSTAIGTVLPGSPAEQAGLQEGDRILAIDGEAMDDWQEVSLTFLTSPERELEVRYERAGEQQVTRLTPAKVQPDALGEAGVYPTAPARIREVLPDTPAERAGFRYADTLLSVNDRPVSSVEEFSEAVSALPDQQVAFTVERQGEVVRLVAVPENQDGVGRIGVSIGQFYYQRFGPLEALSQSVRYNLDVTREIGSFLGKVFERRISAESAIGGPIQIARFSGEAARAGFRELLMFMALLSLNLFLLNMLPIPILDGGQILVLGVEGILRRDLSFKLKERMIQVGLVLIVLLMAMAIYFDAKKVLPGG
jgi:regulator of sigma E protease